MSRIQLALSLIFSDYPICSEKFRTMSNYAAAKEIGVSSSLISFTITKLRKRSQIEIEIDIINSKIKNDDKLRAEFIRHIR